MLQREPVGWLTAVSIAATAVLFGPAPVAAQPAGARAASTVTAAPAPQLPPRASAVRRPPPAPAVRGSIFAGATFQPTTHTFSDQRSFAYDRESASIAGAYDVDGGRGFDVGALVRVWKAIGLGAAATRVTRDSPAAYEAQYPHPFFFSRPRTATVDFDDFTRTELGLHLSVAYIAPQWRRLDVTLFGGPTIFSLEQDLAGDFTPVEVYPYDAVTVTAGAPARVKDTVIGFHAGGGVTWFVTRHIGLGALVRFASGAQDVPLGGQDVKLDVGGVQAGVGLRLRF